MEHSIKLKIGEFSRLTQVTVKTLRHYEEIELLIPFEIDDYTGYRYYNVAQMQTMNSILYLKKLGFSLDEVKGLLDSTYSTPTLSMIREKLMICRTEIKALQERKAELLKLQKHLINIKTMENFQVKSLPAIIVASHREIIKSYQELFNLCPNVIGPEMARLGCECTDPGYCYTIDHNQEHCESDIDIEYCEQVREKKEDSALVQFKDIPAVEHALCYKHYGSYETFSESWAKIYAYLEEKGYQIADCPRFCYIDGIWNKDDENEWLTEIQVPLQQI